MSLLSITGTVTAVGQSQFDNNLTVYAYLEITESSGRRCLIEKVAVCNETNASVQPGSAGQFFFEKMFVYGRRFHCQMWGIKSNDLAVFDRHNLRTVVTTHHILFGLFLLPVGGLGAFWLLPGLASLMTMLRGGANRRALFYGSNPAEARRLQQQQAIRI
jgi:hypothetical protein